MANNNRGLSKAKDAKKDEFYTQLSDIENELRHYKEHFKGKTIFCNCDDPYESNFFKYFILNFNHLGLKKLIATCYATSPIAYTQLTLFGDEIPVKKETTKKPYKVEITKIGDIHSPDDVVTYLKTHQKSVQILSGDGGFQSPECIELLKEADIVVTNPPFSLFREYVAQLMEYEKKFLIIGNQNAISYKEIFPLIKDNKMWLGNGFKGNVAFFTSPYEDYAASSQHKDGLIRVSGVVWFTNLDIAKRHEKMPLFRNYTPDEYPTYDNYDAIEVSKTADIPEDYNGVMGVPITFLDKYNPEQFEILGLTSGRYEFDKLAHPTKRYINPIQINKDGTTTNGSKANTRATILLEKKPSDMIYYVAENAESPFQILYARILIRRRK